MKYGNFSRQDQNSDEYLILVPRSWLESISRNQDRILSLLESGNSTSVQSLGDYITEAEARKLLSRKTTWFWKMRNSGRLASTKVGGTNYYDKKDLLGILDKNKKEVTGLPLQKNSRE